MIRSVPVTSLGPSPPRIATGVRIIVIYKWVKTAAEVLAALALPGLMVGGEAEHLHALALALRSHMVGAWSMHLANLLVTVTTHRYLALTAVALGLDGAFSFVEGWSLWRGYPWGSWLVVIATSSLVPFEILELLREVRVGRVLVLMVNVVIVSYLVTRARRERRQGADACPGRARGP
jgi:uncharacterized membrane protein (DUF2068 family)